MCDASMCHVRRFHGPQAAGSMSHVRRLHGLCATAPWATGGWQAAVCHDAVVSRRRRRHATAASSDFFCVPFGGGGAPTGASLPLRLPLRRRRPRREYADCTYGSDCADSSRRVRACRGGRPRYRSAPRTALQRTRTPRTAIATVAALAPSTWVDSAVRSRFPPIGAHLRRDVQMGIRGPTLIATTAAPARSSNRLIAPTAPNARTAARACAAPPPPGVACRRCAAAFR
jgi:hypothetical protein